jgi:hypothetical protein
VSEDERHEAEPPEASDPAVDDLRAVRDLILGAHPEIVPELVMGSTIAELTASVATARAAYQRVAEAARQASSGGAAAPAVPAGGATAAIDPDRLSSAEKLRRGIAARR